MPEHKDDFPIFRFHPHLVYLDSAASAQKPALVIDAVRHFYQTSYANTHRGLYELSTNATEHFEQVRKQVQAFIQAPSEKEIIFTKSATESLNLLASSLGKSWKEGDNIILSETEHHANLLPWQQLSVEVRFIPVNEHGELEIELLPDLIDKNTKAISLTHCSNVLGTFTDLELVRKILSKEGSEALLIIDASQSVPHVPISVQKLGCDFLVFSSHKLYGPSGVGVLWGRAALLEELPPYQTGGDMIKNVTLTEAVWNDLPWKFEAGTPNLEGVIGLGAALEYLERIGMENVLRHTRELALEARDRLEELPGLKILGDPDPASGIISFTVKGIHPHDLAQMLGEKEICIRAGHHCAAPLHQKLNIPASNRVSLGIYNNSGDISQLIRAMKACIEDFSHV